MLGMLLGDVLAGRMLLGLRLNAVMTRDKRREPFLEVLDLLLDLMDDGVGD